MATGDNGGRPFPEDLDENILLRLPVKSLLRFKCVSKNWYTLIKNPNFIREHLKTCTNHKSFQILVCDYGAPDDSSLLSLISDDDGIVPLPENPDYFQRCRGPLGMTNVIGSVDGRFLLHRVIDEKTLLALFNPATREVRPLPAPEIPFSIYGRYFGFGFDPSTDDYKVVYFEDEYAVVYSCSKDSWRSIKSKKFEDYRTHCEQFAYGTAYLNGAYYWLIVDRVQGYKFLAFDFRNEMFEEIAGPKLDYGWNRKAIVLDDSIAFLNSHGDGLRDVWVMIQPGVWSKRFTFQCFCYFKSWYSSSVIFVTSGSQLVSYNVRTQKITYLGFRYPGLRITILDGGGNCEVYPYKESLVTIKR